MKGQRAFGIRLTRVINQKLEIACQICGITVEDTKAGRKHINKITTEDQITYIYAEKKLAILSVRFTDEKVYVRRIRGFEYKLHTIKSALAGMIKKFKNGFSH